jgi:hypothetical protein
MKAGLSAVLLALSVALTPSIAFGGEHVWGVWSTDDAQAMKTAFTLAESKVRSRGRGCVGRGKNDTTTEELLIQKDGDKVRYGVFISHHNGSCRIKQSIVQDISRETGIDANRIIAAWVAGG